ncbi:hypothetical protein [Haloarcula litorea]|uniref:hypothetical protein n=1 Tax=Haloarcula litorea TaxID=3032579 RepID=UPI0023E8A02A|nr:hypothetical protein [Halomicroarcula sp. GDY20]
MGTDLRAAALGADLDRSLQGVLVAVGLSLLVLVVSFLPVAAGAVVEPGLVIVGFGLASWWAYDNSGLVVSVALVSGPVVARLTYFWWLSLGRPTPVTLPLSFAGQGAWAMWLPVALSLGVVAFAAGVVVRRGRRLVPLAARSGA